MVKGVPAHPQTLRFLFSTAESHPTWRADVSCLFGKYLPRHGIQTDLVAVQESDTVPPWPAGRSFHQRARSRLGIMLADFWLQLTLFWRAFQGYDGLVVRDKPVLALIGYLAARLAGIPFIYWMSFPLPEAFLHLSRERPSRISALRRRHLWLRGWLGERILYGFLMHRADWVVSQSDEMTAELRRKGLAHSRICAVPMGVESESLPPAPETTPDFAQGREVAIYLGSLDRIRKPEIMVDIALQVGRQRPNFLLLVVGDADEPSERGWLAEQARQRGAIPWMHFTGRLPQREAMALIHCARVGISAIAPSELTIVSSPTKPLEYLALGLPVVCNTLPDQNAVIAGSGGGWCVEFDAERFSAAIADCLNDEHGAREKAQNGREWVLANRSYAKISESLARQLHELVGRKSVRVER